MIYHQYLWISTQSWALKVYFKSFSSPTKKLPFVFNKLNMFRIDNDVLTCWPAVSDVIGTPGERRPEYPTDIPIRRGISTRHNFHLRVYVNLDISHFFPRWYRNIKDPCNRYHQWIIVVLSLICWFGGLCCGPRRRSMLCYVLCWCDVLVCCAGAAVLVTPAMTECIQHNTNYPARRMFALHQKPSNLIFSGDIASLPINQVYLIVFSCYWSGWSSEWLLALSLLFLKLIYSKITVFLVGLELPLLALVESEGKTRTSDLSTDTVWDSVQIKLKHNNNPLFIFETESLNNRNIHLHYFVIIFMQKNSWAGAINYIQIYAYVMVLLMIRW